MRLILATVLMLGALISEGAHAQASLQDDVVIMRRVIAKRTKAVLEQPGNGEDSGYYSWKASAWQQSGTCGETGTQTRQVWCEKTGGTKVGDAYCYGNGSGPKPVEQMEALITQTCEYQWKSGSWQGEVPSCGSATQTRVNTCVSRNGVEASPSNCKGTPPETQQTVKNYAGCDFTWAAGEWNKLDAFCGEVTQTRPIYCRASDGSRAPDEYCANSGDAPDASYTYNFPACNPDGTSDSNTKGWVTGEWTEAPEEGCGKFYVSRKVQCVNGNGNVLSDAECGQNKPATEQSIDVTSTCKFSWQYGPTQPAPQGCGTVFATRSVNCVRSDGAVAPGEACGLGERPESQFPETDYSQCKFEWNVADWSEWSSSCGDATRTRAVTCKRSDGNTVDDSSCGADRPASTETSYVTTGCGIAWSASPWRSESTCAANTLMTRDVSCRRSDGQILPDESCAGAKPEQEKHEDDFSTCSYTWSVGEYGEPSTTCGTATVSRTVSCQRSDGARVSEDQCNGAGEKPQASYEVEMATSCTYKWESGDWQEPVAACGATVQNRVNRCIRSDGKTVAGTFCTEAEPARTRPAEDFSTCTYKWFVSQWNNDGSCGDSAVQTRTVACQRSEGTNVADVFCADAGAKPAASQTVTDYTGCKYAWKSIPGTWSSTCSTSATRTNTVTCGRSDGATVGEEYCSADTKPPVSETQENLTQCTYVGTYDSWTTCRAQTQGATQGTQTGTLVSCRRSDNTTVANSFCDATQTRSCSVEVERYVRAPYIVDDANTLPTSVRQTTPVNSAVLKLGVTSTQCWDKQTNTSVSASTCANLPTGTNVYDIIEVPATILPSLREVYVNQADLQAVIPYGGIMLGYQIYTVCSNPNYSKVMIQEASAAVQYGVNCGTPDNPSKYVRATGSMTDPDSFTTTKDKNTDYSANRLNLVVGGTVCWDTSKNAAASSSAKCTYLPTGSNIYDIVGIPATFVSGLREVYVNQTDLQAAMPYGGNIAGYSVYNNFCTAGWTVSVGPVGGKQTWTVRCGTPEDPSSYVRAADKLHDPANYTGIPTSVRQGNIENKNSFNLLVVGTLCRDVTKNVTVANSKCQYLETGANVYDVVTVPATYVKDLREVYINSADVTAALPYGGTAFNNSVSTVCTNGQTVTVMTTGGVAQNWTLRCGTPDSADNYSREIASLRDPAAYAAAQVPYYNYNKESATTLRITVASTTCIDKRTGATAASIKCNYLTTGANGFDYIDVPATQVAGLHEIYVQKDDIVAKAPYVSTITGTNGSGYQVKNSAFCNNVSFLTYTAGSSIYASTLQCGAPDSEQNYEKRATYLNDPYFQNALTTAQRNVNVSTASKMTFVVDTVACYDKRTGTLASAAKCNYISTADNVNEVYEVNATYVDNLREVYFDKTQLLAKYPRMTNMRYGNGSATNLTNLCNGTVAVYVQGPAGRVAYKAYCDRPADTADHYVYAPIRLGDIYTYYNSSTGRTMNQSTSGSLIYAVALMRCYDTNTGSLATDQNKCDYIPKPVTVNSQFTVPATWDTVAKTINVSRSAMKAQHHSVTPDTAFNDVCGANFTTNIGTAKVVCQP